MGQDLNLEALYLQIKLLEHLLTSPREDASLRLGVVNLGSGVTMDDLNFKHRIVRELFGN